MRRLMLPAVAAVLLLASPVWPSTVAIPQPPVPLRITLLGDSLTGGYGSQEGGYRAELGRQLATAGVSYVWTGSASYHGGAEVQELRAGIDAWMAADNPDAVLLLSGTNNAAGGCSVGPCHGMAGFEPAYLDLVARILALSPTAQVFVAMVPYSVAPWAQQEVYVNVAVIHASWTNARVHLVDLSVLPPCVLWDGVHPPDLGYAFIGRGWYRIMAQVYGLSWIPPPDPARVAARRPGYERAPTDGSC